MPSRAELVAARAERALAPSVVPERREVFTSGYAFSRLRVLGVPVPAIRAVVRQISRELRADPPDVIVKVALALVHRGSLEGRQAGWEILARRADAMAVLSPRLIDRLSAGNDNWASVDGFATTIAGLAWRLGRVTDSHAKRWARSQDRWRRRMALVSTVPLNAVSRGGAGDARRTLMIAGHFARERDPMLAKALSWALRALVERDPAAVRRFLQRHAATLPAVVRREVTTKLDTGRKQRPRALRRNERRSDGA